MPASAGVNLCTNHENGPAPLERPGPGAKEAKSMAQRDRTHARRSYGTGSLTVRTDSNGRATWYGRWYVAGRRVKRSIGAKREPGSRDGLTRPQAERELRRMVEMDQPRPLVADGVTVEEATERLFAHLEATGRRPTTLTTMRSIARTHVIPNLGDLKLGEATAEDVERMLRVMRSNGRAPKTRVNALVLAGQVFGHAKKRGWCRENPCDQVERPKLEETAEIRFLEPEEVAALLRAVPEDTTFGATDRVLYLTAVMTGLRQGELLALRWLDVDWTAGRVRVRRNFVRGHWGAPKSRRGSRSVPLADRLAGELELHFQRSAFKADDDLVFADPRTGDVLDHSQLVQRFKKALRAAAVRRVRFHDLRHTFGTRMAASGVPMRTLQEWMGHRDHRTTLIYADYAPSAHEAEMVERAFEGPIGGPKLRETELHSPAPTCVETTEAQPT